jgi:hypothetical protein
MDLCYFFSLSFGGLVIGLGAIMGLNDKRRIFRASLIGLGLRCVGSAVFDCDRDQSLHLGLAPTVVASTMESMPEQRV